MKKYVSPLLILAATIILTSPAAAEVRSGAFTVSPFVGGYTFDGVQHLETNVATGVALGYNITGNWGVEGRFTWVPLQATQGNVPGDYSLFNFHADVLYHFMPERRLVPYVALGGGWSRTELQNDNNDDAILVYGGGVKYSLNDWLALRGDVRQIFSFHSDKYGGTAYWNNFEYSVGVAFQFGGAKPGTPPAAVPQPEAAAPAPTPQAAAPAPVPQAPAPAPITETPVTAPVTQPPVTAPVTQTPVAVPVTRAPVTAPVTQAPGAAPPTEPPETVPAPKAPVPAPAPQATPPPQPPQAPRLAAEGQTSWQAKEGAIKVPEGGIALTGMTIQSDALEIIFDKGFYYEIHVFSKPSRLEIAVRSAVNGLDVDTVTLNRLGLATVRLENQRDSLRVILYPAAGYALPSRIDVTNNFRGLLIHRASPMEKK